MPRLNHSMELPILLLRILEKKSDPAHILSIQDLNVELSESGFEADRRTIYKCLNILEDYDYPVKKGREGRKQGYYLEHLFTPSEAVVLSQSMQNSYALNQKLSDDMISRLYSLISMYEAERMPETVSVISKTENTKVLETIETLLPAIADKYVITFSYYDLMPDGKKKYRHEHQIYSRTPYAIITRSGRYYAVMHDGGENGTFRTYRLDKMDELKVTSIRSEEVNFSLNDYLKTSVNMYHGEGQTIRLRVKNDLYTQILDTFGSKNMIINQIDADAFTVSIKTALTPTLTSWLMQFHQDIEVLYPDDLIKELLHISTYIRNTYEKKGTDL